MNRRVLLLILSIITCLNAWSALPETGKYYRIINANYGTAMGENYSTMTVSCSKKGSDTDYEQIWTLVASGATKGLQNVYTGHYIQSQPNQSTIFKTGNNPVNVTISTATDGHILMHCGGYMHCDAGANVVNWWDTSAEGDHWTFEEVTLDADKVAAAHEDYLNFISLQENASSYNVILEKFFTDNSCSELKGTYASMSDAELQAAMNAEGLPTAIQNIAVKVKNSWADELDSEISKQFRVQEYGAYSVASMWRWRSDDGKGLNASQINDMNNPTGIYTTGRDLLYVFVDSDIPAGCELRFAGCTEGSGGCDRFEYQAGTVLKKGMNVISAGMNLTEYWVMYALTDKSKKPADMPKLKIHVEGGHVMGYVNCQNKDEETTNAEYKKILLAANASAKATGADKLCLRLAVKGNYGMFYWQIDTYNQIWSTKAYNGNNYTPGYRIYKSMLFYDNVLKQEWGLMGFTKWVHDATESNPIDYYYGGEDLYPTYCNNLAITLMGTNGGNPYSTTGYTHMPGVGAVESSYNAERANFDVWCVGHESGHNNQGAINLESCMESSNNTYSNIITFMYGYRMSRGGTFSDNENYFQKNTVFGWRDIGMTMRMYYNLYLYYHLAGNKQDFYPTLISSLRKDPIKFGGSGWIDGPEGNLNSHHATTSWLHFYKKACEAAKEDLTEYFRLWGFFVPVDKACFGDYTSYYVTSTQAEIDAAIAWVKSKGWRENKQILFIEDRLQLRERTDLWAATETVASQKMKPDNGGTWRSAQWLKDYYGVLGDITTYGRGNSVKGNYTYIGSGQSISVTGEGGVGFIVYDTKGNVVAHANTLKFNIPISVAKEGYVIKVVNADGTESEVLDAGENGTEEQRLAALQAAIAATESVTKLIDETGTKVGYYSSEALATLIDLVAQAQTAIKNGDEAQYNTLTKKINAETLDVQSNGSMLQIKSNGLYNIQSYRASSRYLSSTNTGAIQTATSRTNKSSQWLFIPTGDGNYYLQNYNTKKLLTPTYNESNKFTGWAVTGSTFEEAFITKVKSNGAGVFFLEDKGESNCINLNGGDNSSIAVWSEDDGSKWYITLAGEIEDIDKTMLKELITSSESLVDQVCEISTSTDRVTLQCTDKDAPYYISTNKPDADETHGIDKCIDNKASTYFLSDHTYTGRSAYLLVDLGEGNETDALKFYYSTANGLFSNKPTTIKVQASQNGSTFTSISTINTTTTNTTKVEAYTSEVITAPKTYRYWRFTVSAINDTETKYPYFAISRFFLYNVKTTISMKSGYEGIDQALITAVKSELPNSRTAMNGLASPLNYSEAYNALKTAYDALQEAINSAETDIVDVKHKGVRNTEIFDLTGRKVQTTVSGHIYIQNGKLFKAK